MNGLIYNIDDHTIIACIGGGGCCNDWRNGCDHYIWRCDCMYLHYWVDTQKALDQKEKKVGSRGCVRTWPLNLSRK